ncbi:TPA: hypothetical protein ACXGKJ_001148, partial [Klebsiella oxytoca]
TTVCGPVTPTIHRRLRAPLTAVCRSGSPDRCAASPPGILPHCALLPGAALNAPCPGYGFTTVCGPVAHTIHRRLQVW